MAEHFGAELVDLKEVDFSDDLLACVPGVLVRRWRALPVSNAGRTLKVALADPSDLAAIESLHNTLHREVEICVADESQLDLFIERLYGSAEGTDG